MVNLYQVIKSMPDYFMQLTCKNLLLTQYDCPQTVRRESFFNECNYIAYILKGKRVFHKGNSSWIMDEGKAAFVKKGSYIAEKEAGDDWCVMVFFIPDNYISEFIAENQSSLQLKNLPAIGDELVIPLQVDELGRSFFYSMLPYFTQAPPPQESLIELKFKELLLALLGNPGNKYLLAYCKGLTDGRRQSLQSIMNANYTSNLSLEQYARLAHKSLPTFKRQFKKTFFTTPAKWIIQKRLGLAAGLLASSGMSVREITFESGFENPTHFSRVFKEHYGCSPLQYRKQPGVDTQGNKNEP